MAATTQTNSTVHGTASGVAPRDTATRVISQPASPASAMTTAILRHVRCVTGLLCGRVFGERGPRVHHDVNARVPDAVGKVPYPAAARPGEGRIGR